MSTGCRRGRNAAAAVCVAAVSLAAAASAGAPHAQPSSGSVVVTAQGAVRGIVGSTVRRFLGIPYAAPPVGELRWRPPLPHPAWTGTRDATAFGSSCPQGASVFGEQSTNEDCLFLNVFAPVGGAGEPVMVWIHGGGLVSGESSDYLPEKLVAQNVVVVTVNYRLGALGFLAHPSLTAESRAHTSGNYGLLDQQLALRWVRQNIGRFGGDPRNVTLFGESSGGLSVHAQLASPTARGLFQRAIVQSGGYAGSQPPLAAAEASGRAFAAEVGCRAQTAACLRRVSVAALLAKQPLLDVTPVIDGSVLPRSITQAFASGRLNRVSVIEGSNHDEVRFFLAVNRPAGSTLLPASGYRAAIAATLEFSPADAATVAAHYPLAGYPSPTLALAAVGTDALFACRARAAAQALSRYVPTYQYEFNDEQAPFFFAVPRPSFPTGAYHAAELQYLFSLRGLPSLLAGDHETLSLAMVDLWTSFARSGDPGSGWPRYVVATGLAESLVPPRPSTETGFASAHQCAFWSRMPAPRP